MRIKSLFDYLPKVEELPREKMPLTVSKDIMVNGRRKTISVPRRKK